MGVVTPHFGRQMHCSHSSFSVSFSKRVKTRLSSVRPPSPLHEAVEPLNAKDINTLVSPSRRGLFKMSDASGPQRTEVLESNMGEMKVKLSHTRAQIKQMMGMMQHLL